MSRRAAAALLALASAAACAATHPAGRSPGARSARAYDWKLPPGFPVPRVPAGNPMTAEKVELGRRLFHDPRLSGPGTLACAGCHRPELAYTDGRPHALGVTGEAHPRSAMSLTNAAYDATLGWDDPGLVRLEDQVFVPLFNTHPVEMGLAGREAEVLARLADDPRYRRAFRRAFPADAQPISLRNVSFALASFERTLISGDSPFDRWSRRAEVGALDPDQRAGARLFFSRKLGCFRCHSGFNLSGPVEAEGAEPEPPRFHNTGLYDVDGRGGYPGPDTGVHRITGRDEDMGHFRAPTLRNIALTAPYMHDGSIPTLEAVIDHYAAGGRARRESGGSNSAGLPNARDPLVRGFELTAEERRQLVAFLHALTDESFLRRARKLAAH